MPAAVVVGRSLAYCAHPAAAWTRLSPRGRAVLLVAYSAAAYVLTLAVLVSS